MFSGFFSVLHDLDPTRLPGRLYVSAACSFSQRNAGGTQLDLIAPSHLVVISGSFFLSPAMNTAVWAADRHPSSMFSWSRSKHLKLFIN